MIDENGPPDTSHLKPSKLLYKMLIGTALLWTLVVFVAARAASEWVQMICIVSAIAGTLMFVGHKKLWTDWRDKNWHGNYFQMYLNGDELPRSHFVNGKDRANVVVSGWSLYVPMGGWFTRPYLYHSTSGQSKALHVIHAGRDLAYFGVDEVVIGDNSGNCITLMWPNILSELTEVFPDGEGRVIPMDGVMQLLSRRQTQLKMEKDQIVVELARARKHLQTFRFATVLATNRLVMIAATADSSDRLKNTKEGKLLRAQVSGLFQEIEHVTHDALLETNAGDITKTPDVTPRGISGYM